MVKAKVQLSYTVELFVEGESDEAINEWLCCVTPAQARELVEDNGKHVYEDYTEEIICHVDNNSEVDYVI